MSRGIVIYSSKYGSTKRYAFWLKEETGFDIKDGKGISIKDLDDYDVIILGGGVYASGILGLSFLKKNIEKLKGKQIAVFAVGASPYDENAINEIRKLHFKNELENIPLFYCRGKWDEDSMSLKDRMLCKMLQKAVGKKDPLTYEPWERALMASKGKKSDWTDKKYLDPLLIYLGQSV